MNRAVRLGGAALLLAVALFFASRVHLDQDIGRLLPDSNPELRRAALVLRRVMERTVVDLSADGETSVEELGGWADAVAERLLADGVVASARARLAEGDALPLLELLRERAPRLIEPAALAGFEPRLEPGAVRQRIETLARRLQEPDGAHLAWNAAHDPLGVSDLALKPLAALTAGFREARLVDGRILTADGRHLLLFLEPGFPPTDVERTERFLAALDSAAAALPKRATLRHLGTHRSTFDNTAQLRRDVATTATAGVLLTALFAFLAFGRLRVALLALLPALFGGTVALALFALLTGSVPGAVVGFAAVLLGVTVDYAVHMLYSLERGATRPPVRALLVGAATTGAAFLTLRASSLPGVRGIGTFGAVGIGAAALFSILVLPAFGRRSAPARPPRLDLTRVVAFLRRPRVARRLLLGALAATPLLALGVPLVRLDGDPNRLSSLSPAAAADEAAIRATWGEAFRVSTVVVDGDDLEAALRRNDQVARLLEADATTEFGSLSGILPSRRAQDERLAAWHAFWSADRVAALRASLADAVAATPFRARAFEPFFESLANDPPPLLRADVEAAGAADLLRDRLFEADGRVLAATTVFERDPDRVDALADRLAAEAPDAMLLNPGRLVRRLADMVATETRRIGGYAFAAVAFLVSAWLGFQALTLVVIVPLLVSCLWTFGLLGWLGLPVTLANAIFVAFLFGLAVDYSVFLAASRLERFRGGEDRTLESDAAVLFCATTTLLGFGVLTLAGHPVLFSIGATAVIGIACAAICTQVFVPALTGVLLRGAGPNGTPALRHMASGLWVVLVMAAAALRYRFLVRPFRPAAERADRAMAVHRRVADRLRHDTPTGRRVYVDADPARFQRPCIIVANHESLYDTVAVQALPAPIVMLVKGWVWNAPILRYTVRDVGYILTDDATPDEMIERVREQMARGRSVVVFPEGTRGFGKKMARFHRGAFTIARAVGAPVVPVALVNTRDVIRRGTWWVGDHDVRVVVLDEMDPAEFPGELGDRAMARAARARIEAAQERFWRETQTGSRWWRRTAGPYRYLGKFLRHYATGKCKRDPLVRELPALAQEATGILVAGCGHGIMTTRLAMAHPRRLVRAVDSDERKLRTARAAVGDLCTVEFVAGDLRAVELGNPDYALVVDLLHYWPEEIQRELLERIVAALQPGGRILFRDGCSEGGGHSWIAGFEKLAVWTRFTRARRNFCFRSADGWRSLLVECGLEIEAERPDLGLFSNLVLVARKPA